MRAPDFTDAHWRKSTRSNGGGACVEVATVMRAVGVRDSKLGEQSPIIDLATAGWGDLVRHLKDA